MQSTKALHSMAQNMENCPTDEHPECKLSKLVEIPLFQADFQYRIVYLCWLKHLKLRN